MAKWVSHCNLFSEFIHAYLQYFCVCEVIDCFLQGFTILPTKYETVNVVQPSKAIQLIVN